MTDSRLRVLHLGSPSGLYGAERWIIALVRYLDTELIHSTVGAINDAGYANVPLCEEAARIGCDTVELNVSGKANFDAIRKLRHYLRDQNIDVLNTHFYKTDIIGLAATAGLGCKLVSTPHGWTKDPDFKLWAYEMMARLSYPMFDAVAPLSEAIFSSLEKIPGLKSKLHLIRNGVDIREAEEQESLSEDMARLRESGAFVIGYIGRLTAGKGLDTLVQAVASQKDSNWHVAVVGEGEEEDALRQLVSKQGCSDRFHFFGFRPDRLAYLKGFHAFVLPSRSEGIPRCLMEAMAAGIPIIASDIPGCRNLVDGKTTGLLFPVDDVEGLCDRLQALASDAGLGARLSTEARRFLSDNFSAARMAREYETLYRTLANPGK